MVNEKFNVNFANTYTNSKADLGGINFSNNTFSPNYDFDLSEIDQYSDLNIKQIDVSAGADYQINDNFALNLGFTYRRYADDDPYVEDGTGEAYITNFSVSYLF